MTSWIAVLVVGLGSYSFRVAPLLIGARLRLGARTQDVLRHAGMGGIAALLVTSVVGFGTSGGIVAVASAVGAVAVAAAVALRGRSMTLVVLAGGAVYAVIGLGLAALG
jgi:branched-subunit amino acid transport protein